MFCGFLPLYFTYLHRVSTSTSTPTGTINLVALLRDVELDPPQALQLAQAISTLLWTRRKGLANLALQLSYVMLQQTARRLDTQRSVRRVETRRSLPNTSGGGVVQRQEQRQGDIESAVAQTSYAVMNGLDGGEGGVTSNRLNRARAMLSEVKMPVL